MRAMVISLFAMALLLAGLAGCASVSPAFNTESPGTIPWAGGDLQLFFSNPDYTSTDPLVQDELLQNELFGTRKNGFPNINGGIGLMGVWSF